MFPGALARGIVFGITVGAVEAGDWGAAHARLRSREWSSFFALLPLVIHQDCLWGLFSQNQFLHPGMLKCFFVKTATHLWGHLEWTYGQGAGNVCST